MNDAERAYIEYDDASKAHILAEAACNAAEAAHQGVCALGAACVDAAAACAFAQKHNDNARWRAAFSAANEALQSAKAAWHATNAAKAAAAKAFAIIGENYTAARDAFDTARNSKLT